MSDLLTQLDPKKKVTIETIQQLLRKRYPEREFALLFEVRDAAGFSAKRSCDAMTIGLWPSRGCEVQGFEVKVSRSDFLRELKQPEKAEAFIPYCDRWWIIAGDQSVVLDSSQVPPTWGLMVVAKGKLKVVREAPKLQPIPADSLFLAALMKRACDTMSNSPMVASKLKELEDQWKEKLNDGIERQTGYMRQELEHFKKTIAEFEAASGVRIDRYSGKRIGEAVKTVMSGELERMLSGLMNTKRQTRDLLAWMEANVPDLEDPERPD